MFGRVRGMYLPEHFAETRVEVLRGLIGAFPLGALVTVGEDGLTANHIPFLFEAGFGEQGRLIGHVARANGVWQEAAGRDCLVIFQGPAAYISPNWYPTKVETHQVVPTYNYAVVHVHGPLLVHEDAKWLRGVVGKLTKRFEATQDRPWKMADAPSDFVEDQLTRIVGVEIPIQRLVGKWKVSQNRVVADRQGAITGLRGSGGPEETAMAEIMAEYLPGS